MTGLACFVIAGSASAQWTARIDPPDVFGNVAASAQSVGYSGGLVIQCDQKNSLFLAYLIRKKEFERWDARPIEFLIQLDDQPVRKYAASLRNWNANYAAAAISGRRTELVETIRGIAAARTRINLGWVVEGRQISVATPVGEATTAIDDVIAACKLDEIGKPRP